ncbi:MAG TPA: hypothetical protein VGJ18_27210 [Gemmatimonadaceae bacterium]
MSLSRREWLQTVGAAGIGALAPLDKVATAAERDSVVPATELQVASRHAPGDIVELHSTSDVFTPARGRTWMKFSFDFPEPAVVFGDHRFSFLVFTDDNTYGLDRSRMRASGNADALELTCDGFVWAGGQEHAAGTLTATFSARDGVIEWHTIVAMERPIKAVTTVIRDVPRGRIAVGGGQLVDTKDGDLLAGYTFGAGDLHNFDVASITTPLAVVEATDSDYRYFTTLDTIVRPKRYYFQAGERAFRVEAVYEHDAWRNDRRIEVPGWRVGRAPSLDAAVAAHMRHIESAFALQPWESRADVPPWMRQIALVTTLHGMHYTGFVFNDYARQLEILRWMATRIPPNRVLVFLSAWDGRYYWDYPNYTVPSRMGGEAAFRRLIGEAQRLGFKMMPMFGSNAANRRQPIWPTIAGAATHKIDEDLYNINWVDWNNDRHQDGWLTYMNLGADAWRNHLEGRIADVIERFGVDAYFLDIVGGHVNSTTGDMHAGTKRLVENLRAKYPRVACVGEMPYDALHGFIPMYQAGNGAIWRKYSRYFQHLSAPAAGRGSSGVHEWGFSAFNQDTLGLSTTAIPTLQVVDDTFTKYRDTMAAIIERARSRAGIV